MYLLKSSTLFSTICFLTLCIVYFFWGLFFFSSSSNTAKKYQCLVESSLQEKPLCKKSYQQTHHNIEKNLWLRQEDGSYKWSKILAEKSLLTFNDTKQNSFQKNLGLFEKLQKIRCYTSQEHSKNKDFFYIPKNKSFFYIQGDHGTFSYTNQSLEATLVSFLKLPPFYDCLNSKKSFIDAPFEFLKISYPIEGKAHQVRLSLQNSRLSLKAYQFQSSLTP